MKEEEGKERRREGRRAWDTESEKWKGRKRDWGMREREREGRRQGERERGRETGRE